MQRSCERVVGCIGGSEGLGTEEQSQAHEEGAESNMGEGARRGYEGQVGRTQESDAVPRFSQLDVSSTVHSLQTYMLTVCRFDINAASTYI
jgi:hypothetical protein